jgi:hypothetical protein
MINANEKFLLLYVDCGLAIRVLSVGSSKSFKNGILYSMLIFVNYDDYIICASLTTSKTAIEFYNGFWSRLRLHI